MITPLNAVKYRQKSAIFSHQNSGFIRFGPMVPKAISSPISFSSDIHRKRWVTFFPKIVVDAKINVANLQHKLQMRKNFYFDVSDLLNRIFCLN